LEIGGVKALGEPAVDRRQHLPDHHPQLQGFRLLAGYVLELANIGFGGAGEATEASSIRWRMAGPSSSRQAITPFSSG
jgi:hypothetical protein